LRLRHDPALMTPELKKNLEPWLFLGLSLIFYFFGFGFISLFALAGFVFWFFKKRNVFWWLLVILALANLTLFKSLFFVGIFFAAFYFFWFGREKVFDWFLIFLFFVSSFDLFFLSSNFRFILGFCWLLFLGLVYLFANHYFKDLSKIFRLILAFVFSEIFFILYFLPFGNFTNAGMTTVFFLALANYQKNRSKKEFLILMALCLLLLIVFGVKPR